MKTVEPFTPIQYIIGHTQFCGIDIYVNENILIPRPETELLVEKVIELGRIKNKALRILDLCTGSGCIAVAIAAHLWPPSGPDRIEGLTKAVSDCTIIASDISWPALEVARSNADKHKCSDRVEFIQSDLFESLTGKFDIIVSNPPYIAEFEFETLQKEVLREPRLALDGGEDGLEFYRSIISEAPAYLKPGGHILFEVGFGQAESVKEIIGSRGGFTVESILKDFNGIDRVIISRWISS
jgi:release factor glutamine methyltransferase